MINVTFEADTAGELDTLIRSYMEGRGGFAVASTVPRVDDPDGDEANTPTNEDYRRAIRAIPKGKIAAYSVVSEVIRGDKNGSQKVAGLAANDPSLGTAYRVVKKDGAIAAGFRWEDGRMGGADEGRRALEEEGIRFDVHGRALPQYMLSPDELRQLYEDQQHEGQQR